MIQKLTVNLKKSEDYGKKITNDLAIIGNEILQKKIDIVNIQQKILQATKQQQNLTMMLKKQNQQSSNYEYKMQKVEIRLKQFNRKLALQQEIYDKKQAQRQQLTKKIETMQADIGKQNQEDALIAELKKQIEEADTKISKQNITIQNLYLELMNKSKQMRAKEDQLQVRRKANKKKKDNLDYLKNAIKACDNKQNHCNNSVPASSENLVKNLTKRKASVDQSLNEGIKTLINICEEMENISDISANIKKQLNRDWELNQEIKSHKNNLSKIKDSLIFTKFQ